MHTFDTTIWKSGREIADCFVRGGRVVGVEGGPVPHAVRRAIERSRGENGEVYDDDTLYEFVSSPPDDDDEYEAVEKVSQIYELNGKFYLYDHHNAIKYGPFDSRQEAEDEAERRGYKGLDEEDLGTRATSRDYSQTEEAEAVREFAKRANQGVDALGASVSRLTCMPASGTWVRSKSLGLVQVASTDGGMLWVKSGSHERRISVMDLEGGWGRAWLRKSIAELYAERRAATTRGVVRK